MGTGLRRPFQKGGISGMAMEKSKGRTGTGFWHRELHGYKPGDYKGWCRLLWRARKCEKLHEKTMRQEPTTGHLACEGGNIVLTASTSKILLWTLLSFASGALCLWMLQARCERCKGWTQAQRSPLAGVGMGHPKPHLYQHVTCAQGRFSAFGEQPVSALQSRVATFKPPVKKNPRPMLSPRPCPKEV